MNDKIETVLGGVLLLVVLFVGLPLVGVVVTGVALAIVLVAVKLLAGISAVVSFLTADAVLLYLCFTALGGSTIAAVGI